MRLGTKLKYYFNTSKLHLSPPWARAISHPGTDVFNRQHVVRVGFIGRSWSYCILYKLVPNRSDARVARLEHSKFSFCTFRKAR